MAPSLALLLPLTGCGSKQAGDDSSPGAGASNGTVSATPGTQLQISVKADQQAAPKEWTLTCDPVGGTIPDPDKACAMLAKAKPDWYAPVPKDQACTMIFGGPEQATVKGTWQGKQIAATFKRDNGCELARWNAIAALFGGIGGAGTPPAG